MLAYFLVLPGGTPKVPKYLLGGNVQRIKLKNLTVKQLTKKEKSRIASFPPSLSFAKSRAGVWFNLFPPPPPPPPPRSLLENDLVCRRKRPCKVNDRGLVRSGRSKSRTNMPSRVSTSFRAEEKRKTIYVFWRWEQRKAIQLPFGNMLLQLYLTVFRFTLGSRSFLLLRIFRPVSFLLSPRSLQFLEFDSILVLYFPIFWPSHPPPSDSREEKSRRITRGKNERGINTRHHIVFN